MKKILFPFLLCVACCTAKAQAIQQEVLLDTVVTPTISVVVWRTVADTLAVEYKDYSLEYCATNCAKLLEVFVLDSTSLNDVPLITFYSDFERIGESLYRFKDVRYVHSHYLGFAGLPLPFGWIVIENNTPNVIIKRKAFRIDGAFSFPMQSDITTPTLHP